METMARQQRKDIKLIGKFIEVYCRGKHAEAQCASFVMPSALGTRKFCADCSTFMQYAIDKRLKCPLESEKPSCKHCRIHCYAQEQRGKIREIMAYSGRKLMMQGRLDYLWHYFF